MRIKAGEAQARAQFNDWVNRYIRNRPVALAMRFDDLKEKFIDYLGDCLDAEAEARLELGLGPGDYLKHLQEAVVPRLIAGSLPDSSRDELNGRWEQIMDPVVSQACHVDLLLMPDKGPDLISGLREPHTRSSFEEFARLELEQRLAHWEAEAWGRLVPGQPGEPQAKPGAVSIPT